MYFTTDLYQRKYVKTFQNNQAFHKNMSPDEALTDIETALKKDFSEIYVFFKNEEWHGRIKKNHLSFKKKKSEQERKKDTAHNKQKSYPIPEGIFIPALSELGIIDTKGRVFPSQRDKFIQINQFLKVFEQILTFFPKNKELIIWDLCCGKSYLTFILDYFLTQKGYQAQLTGVDLKSDVIEKCTTIAKKLKSENLTFLCDNVQTVSLSNHVDIVVSLHACDIATDIVIKRAICANAQVILAVPCCHKESAKTINSNELSFIMKYGLLKNRFAALVTDALRACFLENNGYKTDVLEFVNFENSPKNVMIRAVKGNHHEKYALETIAKKFNLKPFILKND